jgi:hypothetical protein
MDRRLTKNEIYILACCLGLPLVIGGISLDTSFYPEIKQQLLYTRIVHTLCFFICIALFKFGKEKYADFIASCCICFSGIIVTLQCFVSGDGFACPHYIGHLMLIIVISILFQLKTSYYLFCIVFILAQHFIWLSFIPFTYPDLVKNIFALSSTFLIGLIVHWTIQSLVTKIKVLQGFLPICAKCKKIRDDKGYWNQLELYISKHTDAQFSHSMCPECLKEMYGFDPEKRKKNIASVK